ncbi:MAG: DUF6464 family protein [Verrucomicrobiota bacterium]
MPKTPDCDHCHFYARSPYMVCGVNPSGPEGDECPDYEALEPPRKPLGGGYYAGDWIPQIKTQPTDEQRLALLDWHPIFTGRCPHCEMPISQPTSPNTQWECAECWWREEPIQQ